LLTAGNLLKSEARTRTPATNLIVRLARKVFATTDYYDGDKLFTISQGRRAMTPMLLVMVAIDGTDLCSRSIPSRPSSGSPRTPSSSSRNSILLAGAAAADLPDRRLLDRLIYLSHGLVAILGFIDVKLVLHALHENNVPFINDGEHVTVIEISTGLSLSVILGVLLVTVLASVLSRAGKAQNAISNARRHANAYLDAEHTADTASGSASTARCWPNRTRSARW
jgi:tellurite resistance protein TerC